MGSYISTKKLVEWTTTGITPGLRHVTDIHTYRQTETGRGTERDREGRERRGEKWFSLKTIVWKTDDWKDSRVLISEEVRFLG